MYIRGKIKELIRISDSDTPNPWKSNLLTPLYTKSIKHYIGNNLSETESSITVFNIRMIPGNFEFFEIVERQ